MQYQPMVGQTKSSTALRECWHSRCLLLLATLYKAPEKPQDGMIVKADGTHWNPRFWRWVLRLHVR